MTQNHLRNGVRVRIPSRAPRGDNMKLVTKIECEPGFWQDVEDVITGILMSNEEIKYVVIGDKRIEITSLK